MPTTQHEGPLDYDPFYRMAMLARTVEGPPASVSVLLSIASDDYSKTRVTVTVTCPCPSTESSIAFTTEAAFLVAKRMVNQGAAAIGLPPIG